MTFVPFDHSIAWHHSREDETCSAFCRRLGWCVGDTIGQMRGVLRNRDGVLEIDIDIYVLLALDCPHGECDVEVRHLSDTGDYESWVNMRVPGLRGPIPELSMLEGDMRRWPCTKLKAVKP